MDPELFKKYQKLALEREQQARVRAEAEEERLRELAVARLQREEQIRQADRARHAQEQEERARQARERQERELQEQTRIREERARIREQRERELEESLEAAPLFGGDEVWRDSARQFEKEVQKEARVASRDLSGLREINVAGSNFDNIGEAIPIVYEQEQRYDLEQPYDQEKLFEQEDQYDPFEERYEQEEPSFNVESMLMDVVVEDIVVKEEPKRPLLERGGVWQPNIDELDDIVRQVNLLSAAPTSALPTSAVSVPVVEAAPYFLQEVIIENFNQANVNGPAGQQQIQSRQIESQQIERQEGTATASETMMEVEQTPKEILVYLNDFLKQLGAYIGSYLSANSPYSSEERFKLSNELIAQIENVGGPIQEALIDVDNSVDQNISEIKDNLQQLDDISSYLSTLIANGPQAVIYAEIEVEEVDTGAKVESGAKQNDERGTDERGADERGKRQKAAADESSADEISRLVRQMDQDMDKLTEKDLPEFEKFLAELAKKLGKVESLDPSTMTAEEIRMVIRWIRTYLQQQRRERENIKLLRENIKLLRENIVALDDDEQKRALAEMVRIQPPPRGQTGDMRDLTAETVEMMFDFLDTLSPKSLHDWAMQQKQRYAPASTEPPTDLAAQDEPRKGPRMKRPPTAVVLPERTKKVAKGRTKVAAKSSTKVVKGSTKVAKRTTSGSDTQPNGNNPSGNDTQPPKRKRGRPRKSDSQGRAAAASTTGRTPLMKPPTLTQKELKELADQTFQNTKRKLQNFGNELQRMSGKVVMSEHTASGGVAGDVGELVARYTLNPILLEQQLQNEESDDDNREESDSNTVSSDDEQE